MNEEEWSRRAKTQAAMHVDGEKAAKLPGFDRYRPLSEEKTGLNKLESQRVTETRLFVIAVGRSCAARRKPTAHRRAEGRAAKEQKRGELKAVRRV